MKKTLFLLIFIYSFCLGQTQSPITENSDSLLLSFRVMEKDGVNIVDWSSIFETNCVLYELEWSTDSINWFNIDSQIGSGTTKSETPYSSIHLNYKYGCNYYRILQHDFDGYIEIFGPISIDNIEK